MRSGHEQEQALICKNIEDTLLNYLNNDEIEAYGLERGTLIENAPRWVSIATTYERADLLRQIALIYNKEKPDEYINYLAMHEVREAACLEVLLDESLYPKGQQSRYASNIPICTILMGIAQQEISDEQKAKRQLEVIKLIIENKITFDDINSVFPFLTNKESFELIIDQGANIQKANPSRSISVDNLKLMRHFGLDLHSYRSGNGTGNLLFYHHKEDMVDFLIESGARVESEDHCGQTPIFKACYLGDYKLISQLHSYGANLDHRCDDGRSALFSCSNVESFEKMIELGANLDVTDNEECDIIEYINNNRLFRDSELMEIKDIILSQRAINQRSIIKSELIDINNIKPPTKKSNKI